MRYYPWPMLHRTKNEVNSSVVYCGFVRYANMGYPSSRFFFSLTIPIVKVPQQKRRNNYRIPRLNKLISSFVFSTENCNTFCTFL